MGLKVLHAAGLCARPILRLCVSALEPWRGSLNGPCCPYPRQGWGFSMGNPLTVSIQPKNHGLMQFTDRMPQGIKVMFHHEYCGYEVAR